MNSYASEHKCKLFWATILMFGQLLSDILMPLLQGKGVDILASEDFSEDDLEDLVDAMLERAPFTGQALKR